MLKTSDVSNFDLDYIDQLVSDYLLYRGFVSTLTVFKQEKLEDKNKGFQACKVVDELFSFIRNYDIDKALDLWTHLSQTFFNHLDEELSWTVSKFELSLKRYYLVHTIQTEKPDKTLQFFAKYGRELANNRNWQSWFIAIPYTANPAKDSRFQVFFTKTWSETLSISLRNFLSTIFDSLEKPKLLNFVVEKQWRQNAQKELDRLKTENFNLKLKISQFKNKPEEEDSRNGITSRIGSDTEENSLRTKHRTNSIGSKLPLSRRRNVSESDCVGYTQPIPEITVVAQKPSPPPFSPSSPLKKGNASFPPPTPSSPTPASPRKMQSKVGLQSQAKSERSEFSRSYSNPTTVSDQQQPPTTPDMNNNRSISRKLMFLRTHDSKSTPKRTLGSMNRSLSETSISIPKEKPLKIKSQETFSESSPINCVRFSPNGSSIAAGTSEGVVRIWPLDITNGTAAAIYGNTAISCLDWESKNGSLLFCGSQDGKVRIWHVTKKKIVGDFIVNKTHKRIVDLKCCPPNHTMFAISSSTDRSRNGLLSIWDTVKLESIQKMKFEPPNIITSTSFNKNGSLLLAAGLDGYVRVFDLTNFKQTSKWKAHKDGVSGVRFGTDEKTVLTVGSKESMAKMWDISGGIIQTYDYVGAATENSHTDIAMDVEGEYFILSGNQNCGALYHTSHNKQLQTVGNHTKPVSSVDWHPYYTTCITASLDNTVCMTCFH